MMDYLDGTCLPPGVVKIPLAGNILVEEPAPIALRRCALPSFIAGKENSLVRVAIESALSPSPSPFTPLVLIGPTGFGKSHLAQGLARCWHETHQPGSVVYTTGRDFASELTDAVEHDRLADFHARHRHARLWILEDIRPLKSKLAVQRELLSTLDVLEKQRALVVITSQVPLAELSGIWPSIVSRLTTGLIVPLAPPGMESRQVILVELARLLGLQLDPAAANLLAKRVTGTVPELLKAILDLGSFNSPIDLVQVRDSLAQRAKKRARETSTIIAITARHFGLKATDLKGASRNRTVVAARSTAMYLSRLLTDNSLQIIGRSLGNRDHTTVLHNCRAVERRLQTDATTRRAVEKLLAACRSQSE